jgi:hypothetical protein
MSAQDTGSGAWRRRKTAATRRRNRQGLRMPISSPSRWDLPASPAPPLPACSAPPGPWSSWWGASCAASASLACLGLPPLSAHRQVPWPFLPVSCRTCVLLDGVNVTVDGGAGREGTQFQCACVCEDRRRLCAGQRGNCCVHRCSLPPPINVALSLQAYTQR